MDSMTSAEDFAIDAELSIEVGESVYISTNADDYLRQYLVWGSSGNDTAHVSQNGLVSGIKAGTATVTVEAETLFGSYEAQCTVTVSEPASEVTEPQQVLSGGVETNNSSDNNYTVYSSVVYSYITENEDGTLSRIEYVSGTGVIIETYSTDGTLKSTKTVQRELSIFGGFFSGETYNFLIFGQSNYNESDDVEVIRIVKYSKDWERLDSLGLSGINTYLPFRFGSARMAETGGLLYLYTCHTMYEYDDGYHHLANMTFVINEEDMVLEDSLYDIWNNSYGYVSHSFNQFI